MPLHPTVPTDRTFSAEPAFSVTAVSAGASVAHAEPVGPVRRPARRFASAVALTALLAAGAAVPAVAAAAPAGGDTAVAAGSDSLIWG